jgi:hypothetical protein
MLIEYKIKFEKDGLTVSQRIEPNSTQAATANGRVKSLDAPAGAGRINPLVKASRDPASGPHPPSEDTSSGPNPPSEDTSSGPIGQSPIFVLGPIVFNNPAQASAAAPAEQPNNQQAKPPKGKAAGRGA